MSGIVEDYPDPKYELDDVLYTADGMKMCIGRDMFERRAKDGKFNSGWRYQGISFVIDRKAKEIKWTGNVNNYSERMIRSKGTIIPHPKTGEPTISDGD